MNLPCSLLNRFILPILCATGTTLAFPSSSCSALALLVTQGPKPVSAVSAGKQAEDTEDSLTDSYASEQENSAPEKKENPPLLFENKLFAMPLPQNLTPPQRQTALELMREAEPRLSVMHNQLRTTLEELHNLSFASDTPPDALSTLGKRLVKLRNDIMLEMRRLSLQMEKKAGFNPGWGTNSCSYSAEIPVPPCERLE